MYTQNIIVLSSLVILTPYRVFFLHNTHPKKYVSTFYSMCSVRLWKGLLDFYISLRIVEIGCVLGSPSLKKPIKWYLRTSKLFAGVAQRQRFRGIINKTKHLEFAKPHWNYVRKRMLWSDETKMDQLTASAYWVTKCNTNEGKHLIPPVKYRGS